MSEPSPTRWALAGEANRGYGRHFAQLLDEGEDVDGEARLADALVARNARVLDVGSGMGRVAAALSRRGHRVVAVEPDRDLVDQSLDTYPGLTVLPVDARTLEAQLLSGHGVPTAYELVVLVGNVMVFLAEGSERDVLGRLRDLLAPGGRILVGFHPVPVRTGARAYPPGEFVADVEASRLRVELRAGSYELHPPRDDYTVWVLGRPEES